MGKCHHAEPHDATGTLPPRIAHAVLLKAHPNYPLAQERLTRRAGLSDKQYALMAPNADGGVAAINRWLRRAGYPQAVWGAPRSSTALTEAGV